MSKAKTESADSLKSLKLHLRRDKIGKPLVQAVDRYVGELRQNQSALKLKLSVAESGLDTLDDTLRHLRRDVTALHDELQKERSINTQLKRQLVQLTPQESVEPEPGLVATAISTPAGFCSAFRTLQARMRHMKRVKPIASSIAGYDIEAPRAAYRDLGKELEPDIDWDALSDDAVVLTFERRFEKKVDKAFGLDNPVHMFTIGDFTTSYDSQSLETVGLFALLNVLMGQPVGFTQHGIVAYEFADCLNDVLKNEIARFFIKINSAKSSDMPPPIPDAWMQLQHWNRTSGECNARIEPKAAADY